MVGFNPQENLIYVAVCVRDDSVVIGSGYLHTDGCEVYVDGTHSGGTFMGAVTDSSAADLPALEYFMCPPGGTYGIDAFSEWTNPALHMGDISNTRTEVVYRRQGDLSVYEWAIEAFDQYPDTPTALLPGKTIGFDVVVADKDTEMDRPAWVSWAPFGTWKVGNADLLGDLVLIEGYGSIAGIAWTVKERGMFFKIPLIGWLGGLFSSSRARAIGAQIHALQEGAVKGTATADEEGKYQLQLVPGQYRLSGSLPGFIGTRPEIPVVANQTTKRVDMTLQKAGAISGSVFLADGQTPLLGADMEVMHQGMVKGTDQTGSDGQYRVGGLEPGLYGVGCSTYDVAGGAIRRVVVRKGQEVGNADFLARDLQSIVLIDTVGRKLEEAETTYRFTVPGVENRNPALRLRVNGLAGRGYGGNLVYLNDHRIGRLQAMEGYQEIPFSPDLLIVGENTMTIKFVGPVAGKVEDLVLCFKAGDLDRAKPTGRTVGGMGEEEEYAWPEYHLAMQAKEPSKKIELLERVAEAYPTSWVRNEANQELFRLYADQDDREKMKEYADKLVSGRWPNPAAFNNVAWTYAKKGILLDQALAYADTAVRMVRKGMHEQLAPILDTRGWVRFKMEAYEEALADFKQATELKPDPAVLYHQRKALEALGRDKEAQELLKAHQLNKPAPSFSLKDLAGDTVRLEDLRGKVVVLDFWATWCGPCRMAMPHIQRVYQAYKEEDVVVLGINTREPDKDKVEPFLKEHTITYRNLLDLDGKMAEQYGVRGIPALFVIDPQGLIQFEHVGHQEDIFEVLSWEIEVLKGAE
jgi:peroxiredoxin